MALTNIIKSVVRVVMMVAVSFVILSAVLLTIARNLTPLIDDHKVEIANWASDFLQQPVSIEGLEASWRGLGPEIILHNVSLLSKQDNKRLLNIAELDVRVNIIRSLWARRVVPSLIVVSGAKLDINQDEYGNIEVAGATVKTKQTTTNTASSDPSTKKAGPLLGWFLQQRRIALQNVEINIHRAGHGSKRLWTERLVLYNNRHQHQLIGDAQVIGRATQLYFAIKFNDHNNQLKDSDVDAYVRLQKMLLRDWLPAASWRGLTMRDGLVDASAWLHWRKGKLDNAHSRFSIRDTKITSKHIAQPEVISRMTANLHWQSQDSGWKMSGDHIHISTNNGEWPQSHFELNWQDAAKQSLALSYLQLSDLHFLLGGSELLDNTLRQHVVESNLQGSLSNIIVRNAGEEISKDTLTVGTDFSGLGFSLGRNQPGLRDLQGAVTFEPNGGALVLDAQKSIAYLPNLYHQGIFIDHLRASMAWKEFGNSWRIFLNNLDLTNKEVSLESKATIIVPSEGKSPKVSGLLRFDAKNITQQTVSRYIPNNIDHPNLVKWLKNAFPAAKEVQGAVLLRGKLNEMPFDHHDGRFLISGHVKDLNLDYHSEWPMVRHADADIDYQNRGLNIKASKGQTLDAQIISLQASIPYIAQHWDEMLKLHGIVRGDMTTAMQFINDSPLRTTVGEEIEGLEVSGPMMLDLRLAIPLGHDKVEPEVNGAIALQNSRLSVLGWGFNLDGVRGGFRFNKKSIATRRLYGRWFGYPMNLSIATLYDNDEDRVTQVSVGGRASIKNLHKQFGFPIFDYMQGETDFRGILQLRGKDKPDSLSLQSDLSGVEVDLPKPFSKPAAESVPFSLKANFGDDKPMSMRINYSDWMDGALVYQRGKQAAGFDRGEIRLHDGAAKLPEQAGLVIAGKVPTWRWEDWQPFVDVHPLGDEQGKSAVQRSTMSETLRLIDVSVGKLSIWNRQLDNAKVQAQFFKDQMRLNVDSQNLAGDIAIPLPYDQGKLVANLQRLYLFPSLASTNKTKTETSDFSPKQLPEVDITAKDFRYRDNDYGALKLNLVPEENGTTIKKITLDSPVVKLDGTGSWREVNGQQKTSIKGHADSADIATLLKYFDLDFGVELHDGNADFDLSWPAQPSDFSVNHLSGIWAMRLGRGRIIDIGEEANSKMSMGRMLNMLSIQNLPRRLILDFSDLTKKGFDFNVVDGKFKITDGDAVTENIYLDGSVARIDAEGRVGLAKKDFDLRLMVTAHVTSSLPVVATVAAGPVAGAVSWLFDRVVSSEMQKTNAYHYTLTGPWRDPEIEQHVPEEAKQEK